ncbi:PD40 domain-containing protein [Streptomyces sp. NRRL B-24085]|uniref:PD40 domain-containing protein n=1 Tax=Streptomyces sp. NRRL B-24085 TaxID=1709476 RepID=UPI0006B33F6D|nr:PD40 domain-containing protein [Streptomyces sp. NRRL B-24085]
MSRAAVCLLGAALLVATAGANASAASHADRPATASRTERVSTAADGSQADGPSGDAAISADGRRVAFVSRAPSFGCARFTPCLLVKDVSGGEVTKIDLGSGHTYSSPEPSADGSRIAFSAGTRFPAPYLYDRATGRAERLWPQDPPGPNELGHAESISPDGTHVAYTLGNRNGDASTRLLYVRDTATGTDALVSPAEEGQKIGASVSGDGTRVAYGLRVDSEQDPADVYVRDRTTGERTQVDTGLGAAHLVRITADGRRVLLDAESGLYVHDLRTGTNRRVADGNPGPATADGRYAVVSGEDGTRVRDLRTGARGAALPRDAQVPDNGLTAKGRAVVFRSSASHLVPGDTNGESDVFVFSGALRRNPAPMPSVTERIAGPAGASHDPVTGENKVVSFTSEGDVFVSTPGGLSKVNSEGQKPSSEGTPCYSGRMVGYVAPSADGGPGVHVRNRSVGKLTSLGSYEGVRFTWMGQPVVNPTCQWLTFAATLPATGADPDPQPRVYRFEFNGGDTDVVSAPTGEAAGHPSVDYSGRYVAFEQGGSVYVRDLDTGALEKAAAHATAPSLGADGRRIAYQQGRTSAVRDLDTGTTTRVGGTEPSLSGDGTRVAYTSGGSVYALELSTGKRQLISVDRWGGRNDRPAGHPSVNADGTVVAFESASPDLVEGDTDGVTDVFLRTVQ